MKICPKCGQEMDGTVCKNCSVPEIIVNNNEYLQRKKAYEEKQAREQVSASPSNSDAVEFKIPVEEVLGKIKKSSTIVAEKVKEISQSNGNLEKNEPTTTNVSNDELRVRKNRRKKRKRFKPILICIVLGIFVAVGAFGIYELVTRKNYTLYMSYNGKVYDATSLDSTYVCELSEAVFAADKKTFYVTDWPENINRSQVMESCVSQNGEYFCAALYDEETLQYEIYVWSEDGCVLISKNQYQKNIKTITDDGIVIYTDMQIFDFEGNTGVISLYVCTTSIDKNQAEGQRLTGTNLRIESELIRAYVYEENNQIICYNTNNQIYVYDYKKNKSLMIEKQAASLLAMSADTAYLYTTQEAQENLLSEANSIIYLADGVYYYYNLDNQKIITIGKASGTNLTLIYEQKGSRMYLVESGIIKVADIKNDKVGTFYEVDRLGSQSNMVYMSDDYRIVYINKDNELRYISNGTSKLLRTEVNDGTLSKVGNTTDGFTYIAGETQYYRADISAAETAMHAAGNKANTGDTYLYKKRLYFYNSEKELYSCTQKGTDDNKIGLVDSLWLGTEWK